MSTNVLPIINKNVLASIHTNVYVRLTMTKKIPDQYPPLHGESRPLWPGNVFYANKDKIYNKEKLAKIFGLMRPSDACDFFAGDFSLIN